MDEAAEVANMLAPEHLQILTNNPLRMARNQSCGRTSTSNIRTYEVS
jgi:histidinol dehydrogenase